ncbi:porin family protein [Mucilaginibacter galii]|uniref:Outer membrane protein beta-barrel domain-containing protein n=1 Tax=Mucilaginibacter galii TaxID=2005073 RepID=A0A917N2D4_9SPHI|nr:porin family protein [Mucilaginibacter galii]GGI51816.1 hypothetical protein GCM10011425_30280 [Mucilaginibacter galii]
MYFRPIKTSLSGEVFKNSYAVTLALLFAILFATPLKAQTPVKKTRSENEISGNSTKFEIGLAGGLSLNKFSEGQPQTGQNTGYTGGLSVNYALYKGFSLQLEANYLQQGGQMIRFKDDTRLGLPETFESKNVKNSSYKLNSLEIPLLVNYTFNIKQSWKPTLYAGASYAYAFNVTENYQKTGDLLPGEDIISTVKGSQSAEGLFKSSRYNWIAGANVKLPLTLKFKLLLDFRYLAGITPARENYSYMEKVGFGSDIRTNSFVSKVGVIMSIN